MSRDLAEQISAPPSRQRVILLGVALLLAALVVAGRCSVPAVAHNDDCVAQAGEWHCTWADPELTITTPHWFNADVKLHDWDYVAISDGRGGAVAQKCVHIMRGSDSYLEPVACGPGIKDGFVNSYMRPGYLYTRYDDSPTTAITGEGTYR